MLFKSAKIQQLDEWSVDEEHITEKLNALSYKETSPTQESSMGWVSPFGNNSEMMYAAQNGAYLFQLMVEKKTVNASLLKREMEKEIARRQENNPDYNPDKEEKNEIKEAIKLRLLPDTPPSFSEIRVMVDTNKDNSVIIIETTSDKNVEVILNIMESTFGTGFEYSFLSFSKEPSEEMKNWIVELDLPVNFTLGEACKLKDPSSKTVIQYKNHDLDDEKIVDYLSKGMEVTDISMEWKEDISFSMNNALTVSGIKMRGVYKEQRDELLGSADEKTDAIEFDANFSVMISAFRDFVPQYIAIFK